MKHTHYFCIGSGVGRTGWSASVPPRGTSRLGDDAGRSQRWMRQRHPGLHEVLGRNVALRAVAYPSTR
jgi:hypothetical protein